MTISVRINDEAADLAPTMTVADLVGERYPDRRWLAVAVDGEVVPRSRWADETLRDGAAVEILTAVQGG